MAILNSSDLLVVMISKTEHLFSVWLSIETLISNLDIRREEVAVRCEGSVQALRAEGHPVSLHVTGGVATLLADIFVDVGLQNVVP